MHHIEASRTKQVRLIRVSLSVKKSLNDKALKCEYLQNCSFHKQSTYNKVARTNIKLLVKSKHPHSVAFWNELLSDFWKFHVFYYVFE